MSPSINWRDEQPMSIDWHDEIQKMFAEERGRQATRANRPCADVRKVELDRIEMIRKSLIKQMADHVEGYLADELYQLSAGMAEALRLTRQDVRELVSKMIDAGELIVVDEKIEWPEGSGWESNVKRLRLSPDAWIKAVG